MKKSDTQVYAYSKAAFTLIELIVVIAIIGIASGIFLMRSNTSEHWKQEGMLRRLIELVPFLHGQALADQAFYRLEFDLDKNLYRVGVMKSDTSAANSNNLINQDAGALSLELAYFLNPSLGADQTMIPPPAYPSMAEPVFLTSGVSIEDIRTMRGKKTKEQGGKAYILFSPRGFSEFAVIHLRLNREQPLTILINPFTGLAEVYREYKDFEWTYGKKQKRS